VPDRAGETVVVGGTWAALVAADALATAGEPVRLLLPHRGVGGGFAPRVVHGRSLELGLRVLELGHEAAPAAADVPPLRDHDPAGTGHVPYLPLVDAYVRALAGPDLVRLAPSATAVAGRLADDLFLTADPQGVRSALSADQRRRAAAELRDVWGTAGPGAPEAPVAAGPGALGDGTARTLAEASLANHGPTVHHALVAPFAAKVVAGGADAVLAAARRRIWTPVLWPRSTWEACAGVPFGFRPARPQHGIRGGVGVLVDRLLERLAHDERVTIETPGRLAGVAPARDGDVRLRFAAAPDVVARRPVLATPAAELFAAAGVAYAPVRARTVVAWVEVADEHVRVAPPVVHVVDPAIDALRITAPVAPAGVPAGRTLFCVELRHDLPEASIAVAARAGLERTGLVGEAAPAALVDGLSARTFPLPTRATAAAFAAARAAFDDAGIEADVVGGATGLTGDYLNEQIVAGLACAERRAAGVAA
jgi:hypothetical protein